MAPLTHRAGWRIAGVHVALREGGSIRLEFLLELFFVSRQRKADVALLNQTTIWARALVGSRGLPCRLKPADSRL